MRRILLVLPALLLFLLPAYAQKPFHSAAFGLNIDTPAAWAHPADKETIDNMQVLSLNDEQRNKLLEMHNGTVPILTLSKRPPGKGDGIIPTIRIGARQTATKDMNELMESLRSSVDGSMKSFNGFKYITPFALDKLNGVPVIRAAITYNLPLDEHQVPARTYMYIFLRRGYFIQVALSDGGKVESEEALFTHIAQTIRFD